MITTIALAFFLSFGTPQAPAAVTDPLVHEGIVDAPLNDVWNAFTTKQGLESWMVAHAEIDLRVGGKMVTHYQPEGKLGDEGTIENTILCYDPKRLMSIKVAKYPKGFPFPTAVQKMWTNIYFEDAGANRTKVTVRGLGWEDSEESQKMRKFFDYGNRLTLERLQAKFKKV